MQEIRYKVPFADDVLIKKETWHAVCDFCYRLGALLERAISPTNQVPISSVYGKFLRVVGVGVIYNGFNTATSDFTISADHTSVIVNVPPPGDGAIYYVVFSSRPEFDNVEIRDGKWSPKLPSWFVEKYGECLMHGALMRIFIMARQWQDINLARMHAVAYNNDLTRLSFGLITSGMRKHLLIDVEDYIVNAPAQGTANGNG